MILLVLNEDAHLIDKIGSQVRRLNSFRRKLRNGRNKSDMTGNFFVRIGIYRDVSLLPWFDLAEIDFIDISTHPFRRIDSQGQYRHLSTSHVPG